MPFTRSRARSSNRANDIGILQGTKKKAEKKESARDEAREMKETFALMALIEDLCEEGGELPESLCEKLASKVLSDGSASLKAVKRYTAFVRKLSGTRIRKRHMDPLSGDPYYTIDGKNYHADLYDAMVAFHALPTSESYQRMLTYLTDGTGDAEKCLPKLKANVIKYFRAHEWKDVYGKEVQDVLSDFDVECGYVSVRGFGITSQLSKALKRLYANVSDAIARRDLLKLVTGGTHSRSEAVLVATITKRLEDAGRSERLLTPAARKRRSVPFLTGDDMRALIRTYGDDARRLVKELELQDVREDDMSDVAMGLLSLYVQRYRAKAAARA